MPDERIVYGCPGADGPEALPFIKEVDGSLYYTCPDCTEQLAVAMAELDMNTIDMGELDARTATRTSPAASPDLGSRLGT